MITQPDPSSPERQTFAALHALAAAASQTNPIEHTRASATNSGGPFSERQPSQENDTAVLPRSATPNVKADQSFWASLAQLGISLSARPQTNEAAVQTLSPETARVSTQSVATQTDTPPRADIMDGGTQPDHETGMRPATLNNATQTESIVSSSFDQATQTQSTAAVPAQDRLPLEPIVSLTRVSKSDLDDAGVAHAQHRYPPREAKRQAQEELHRMTAKRQKASNR